MLVIMYFQDFTLISLHHRGSRLPAEYSISKNRCPLCTILIRPPTSACCSLNKPLDVLTCMHSRTHFCSLSLSLLLTVLWFGSFQEIPSPNNYFYHYKLASMSNRVQKLNHKCFGLSLSDV